MALVRRNVVLGTTPGRVVAAATVAPAQQAVGRAQVPAHIPAQAGPADASAPSGVAADISAPGGAPGGAPGSAPGGDAGVPAEIGTAVAVAGGDIPAPGGEAAAVPPQQASIGALVSAFLLVAAGGAVSWAFWRFDVNAQAIHLPDATTIFAALFAFATAVERILEPFARFLPGKHARGELEKAVANLANKYHEATLDDLIQVAHAKSMVEKGRASRGLVSWGLATAIATIASSAGGIYLLHAMADEGWNGIPVWVDAIVTGIVVGSGTKPLHDVISKVQKNKEKSEDTTAA
ncbi:hypothetical protein GCM10010399_12260 [Dactylosporangium fulvum]|uniref:Uncharacterized protein n=1 Tax=Dactylosporangium fulvum TaxID=53359 RepID=A0ABY5W340_9ACTN|nr:hypothetical protein [Dactylosporangium fulvum]UWP84362.1 hypothetical protein Dfulv_09045 [Dactylosporangium fulvum]